jgi:hypothetical protein
LETPTAKPSEEDNVDPKAIQDIATAVAKAVWDYKLDNPYADKGTPNDIQAAGTILRYVPSRSPHQETWAKIDKLEAELAELKASLTKPQA